MGSKSKQQIFMLAMCLQFFVIAAFTDFGVLSALMADWKNIPPSWSGSDPCGDKWEGIECNNSRITSMVLSGMGVTGTLSADIGNFPELKTLDLSANKGMTGTLPSAIGKLKNLEYLSLADCNFFGPIPETIGSLTKLATLTFTSNNFSGELPSSIGNLINLYSLDLTNNKLTGTIPVSSGTSPGLDLLVNTQHFHCGQNMFQGKIPDKLFNSNMTLIHLIFDSNQLVGGIPSTINSVQSLQVIQLDRNSLDGTVNFEGLSNMTQLYLSNNKLIGPMPDLSSMKLLTYVDMSNNSFDASSIPPWFLSLEYLTALIMERTRLQGVIPPDLFSAAHLQSIVLSNNQLNGTLDISTNFSRKMKLIDLQNNNIIKFTEGSGYNEKLMLQGNPFCDKIRSSENYCNVPQQPNFTYSTQPNNCEPIVCSSNQIRSPNCKCAYPIIGSLQFLYASFKDLGNKSIYTSFEYSMIQDFKSNQVAVDSVAVSGPMRDKDDCLSLTLQVFPSSNDRFNRTGFSMVTSQLNNIGLFSNNPPLGSFHFTLDKNDYFAERKRSSNTGIIIGAGVGSSILVLLLLMALVYKFNQRRRVGKAVQLTDPFASWDQNNNESSGISPQITGVRCFSFKELQKCTNNFSDANFIGSGGYGKVYRGILTDKTLVAIKRSRKRSLHSSVQFKTEIELLSRVHHKNLVSLIGFCYEFDEQMLVYEYIPNGTLKDCISGKSGIRLSWERRLKAAVDSARGLAYLHEHANPPIIHRDVKSTNILLDDQLVAKVADFGMSKLLGQDEGKVSENVKGTMGYLDPEYCVTRQATEKSDVYSFGVIMLELLTGRNPIDHGIYLVKVVRDKTKDLYNLHEIIDPAIRFTSKLSGLEKFVNLAIMCVDELRANRPTMSEVAKEIENILELNCTGSDVEMLSTSTNLDGSSNKRSSEHSTRSFPDYRIEV